MASREPQWPDDRGLKVSDDDGLITYFGKPIGQVLPARQHNEGKEWIYTNNYGDYPCYTRWGAAYAAATHYIRGKR